MSGLRSTSWVLLLAATACVGRMSSSTPMTREVNVVPSSALLTVGDEQRFTTTLVGVDGSVAWSLGEADGGLLSADGRFTATRAGTFHVVARVDDVTGSATVSVVERASSVSVSLSPHAVALAPGGIATFSASVTGATDPRVRFSVEGGGSITDAGVYTAPSTAGVFHVVARSVAAPDASDVATVTVTVRVPGVRTSWTASTAGMVSPHFDNGYGGAFDQSPEGRSDSVMICGWDESEPTALRLAFGVIGQTTPLTVLRFPNAGGNALDYGSCWQDTVRFDLHVAYGTFGDTITYWRFHPQRTGPGGAITGFTATQFSIGGAKAITYPAIQEFVDGNGVTRLALYGATPGAGTSANLQLLVSTAAAGVTPSSEADFTGPSGEPAAVTVVTLPVIAYDTACGFAQHRLSRKLELFFASGQHGATGPQRLATLTPSGGGFTLGAPRELPTGIGDAYARAGLGDEVWLLWADRATVHLSQVDSAGTLTLEAVPTPEDSFEDYRGPRHLALAPDGRLLVVWYLDSVTPARVRANVFDGQAWLGWLDTLPDPGTIFNYQPLQGLAQHDGALWGGTVLSVSGAETLVTTASF